MRFFAARLDNGRVVERCGPFVSRGRALEKARVGTSTVRASRELWVIQSGEEV